MQPFTAHTGLVGVMDRADVDTDQIIPKQFLKRIERSGYEEFLFFDWRFHEDGSVDSSFELNQPEVKGASVLVARRNFGCGSSREHAVWALENYGFRVVIAPSFADIFYNNCFKNGILPVVLPQEQVEALMGDAAKGANARVTVDLVEQTVTSSDGEVFRFEVDAFKKHCLLNGLDDIGLTLENAASSIDAFEAEVKTARPWV